MKLNIWVFFQNLLKIFSFHYVHTTIPGTFHEDQYTFLNISHSIVLRMRNVSDKRCRENENTHFVFSKFFFFENRAVYEVMSGKYCRAGQTPDENMAHAHCVLDTWIYKHTLRICNTYCCSSTTLVARTHLNIAAYTHWPCLYILNWDSVYCAVRTESFFAIHITLILRG